MPFKKIITSFSLILSLFVAVALTACNKTTTKKNSKNLFVDLHTLMPTASEMPTPDQPNPINASRYIAKSYSELTGTKITWATDYAKPTDNITSIRQWFNTQISVNNCPQIGFTFGTEMQEDGLYLDLTEYLEKPNPYVEGNVHWKDIFNDWVWEDSAVKDASGRIVSIPIVLDAGCATAVYYNKDLFTENGFTEPKTWKEMSVLSDGLKKVSGIQYPYAPYSGDSSISLTSWAFRYNLAPGFAKHMMDRTDYDKSGRVSTNELIRAIMEDEFNPNTCQEAKALYVQAYKYYSEFLPTGWQSISDWLSPWDEARVAMKNQGIWYYTNESSDILRSIDFDTFVPLVVQSDSSSYASDIEYKSVKDGYESSVLIAFNIMTPGVNGNQELIDSAIDFLMYLTTQDAMTTIVEEYGNGTSTVKIDSYPSNLDDAGWFDKEFPVIQCSDWPIRILPVSNQAVIDASFQNWVLGQITQGEFFTTVNNEMKKGAETMINKMGLDTTGWNIK